MARLDQVHPAMRAALLAMECPTFDTQPWVAGPALSQQRGPWHAGGGGRLSYSQSTQRRVTVCQSLESWKWHSRQGSLTSVCAHAHLGAVDVVLGDHGDRSVAQYHLVQQFIEEFRQRPFGCLIILGDNILTH